MEKLLAKSVYGWGRAIALGVTTAVGIYSEYKEQKVAGLGSNAWFALSFMYCMSLIMHLLAKILVKMEAKEEG